MTYRFTTAILVLCYGATTYAADHFQLSTIGSERATQGSGNKIVTFQDKTHVVWQDSTKKGYYARIRTLDHRSGKWSVTYTLGKGRDNHARPTLTVDSKGFLHVIIGGHHTGLQYRRSIRPNDASSWTKPVTFGRSTYPVLVCGPDDTLYLTGRHDAGWRGMDFYIKPPGKPWQRRGLLIKKAKKYQWYAAYPNSLAWGPKHKTLHMSVGFFEGYNPPRGATGDEQRRASGHHQAVGYMRSTDFGRTWVKADGTPARTPATAADIDLIEEGHSAAPQPGIRHCGMVVDSRNRPFVVYIRHTPKPGQLRLVTPDSDGKWQRLSLQKAIEKNWPGWGGIDCKVSITKDDTVCLLATLVPLTHPKANWKPGIYGRPAFWTRSVPNVHRIVWLESKDGGKTFKSRDIVPHDPKRGTLLPTLERPTGFNVIRSPTYPCFMYFVGLSRYTRPGEVIDNKVHWVQVK